MIHSSKSHEDIIPPEGSKRVSVTTTALLPVFSAPELPHQLQLTKMPQNSKTRGPSPRLRTPTTDASSLLLDGAIFISCSMETKNSWSQSETRPHTPATDASYLLLNRNKLVVPVRDSALQQQMRLEGLLDLLRRVVLVLLAIVDDLGRFFWKA